MIVDNQTVYSKPQEIIKKLLRIECKKGIKFPRESVNNSNYQPLKGA